MYSVYEELNEEIGDELYTYFQWFDDAEVYFQNKRKNNNYVLKLNKCDSNKQELATDGTFTLSSIKVYPLFVFT